MNALVEIPSRALTTEPRQAFDLSPQTFEQALTFSEYLAKSEMVPKAYRGKPGDCLIAMQWGYEVGLKPLQALQSIATINGKPGLYGDAGKAILLSNGCIIDEDDIEIVKRDGRARCKIVRPGRPPVERTFTLDDAKTAGLWGKEGPWRTYPFRQMAWRAFWFAARDAASDLLRGMAGAEELVDMPERHMGPVDEVTRAHGSSISAAADTWPDDAFGKQFQRWKKAVSEGLKTTDDILALARSKGALTAEQEAKIRAIKPAEKASADAPATEAQDSFVDEMNGAEQTTEAQAE